MADIDRRPEADKPHVLIVYYSFSRQTAHVAATMGHRLRERGCEVSEAPLEFTDAHYGKRFASRPMRWPIVKIVSMLPAQIRRRCGDITIPEAAARGEYDLVVVGSPTWWLTTCMPVRSYLHHGAATRALASTPFATFTTSRRYYRGNLNTMRELGIENGGVFVDSTRFVAGGNQVMSMWSWLAFMRHDVERSRSFGVRMPKPNLKVDYERQATAFIDRVAESLSFPSPLAAADPRGA